MPSLGPAEILVILVIALLVFGPDKMPEIARQVGRGFREFKRVQQHLKAELRDVVSEFDSEDTSKETGTPTPAPTGDPVPMHPTHDDLPAAEHAAEPPASTTSAFSAAPPSEVALPPAEVASPPAEVALPPSGTPTAAPAPPTDPT